MPSLKELSEEHARHEEIFDKLGTDVGIAEFVRAGKINNPREAADARAAARYHMSALVDEYSRERSKLLALVKNRSKSYTPETIIVLGGEQFVEDTHGEFVRTK
jgi:nicotinic acid mononucleotide adenylyltransferase